MKYLIVLTDGAAGRPVDEIGGKTALEAADMKCIDSFAARGEMGMVKTVPEGMAPGSDVANLSVMGYAPEIYHTGQIAAGSGQHGNRYVACGCFFPL